MDVFEKLIGNSDAIISAKKLASKGAMVNVPILLNGQSGVGKEIFARAIHNASDRSEMPLIIINCGAIPANLVESILFGHVKGSFTGAIIDHRGKFVDADKGTIFLDEIGELPQALQVKLLRVLQEGEVDPIGGNQPIKVDVRIISATNKKLEDLVSAGHFREDLYYRLNVFPVDIPPLQSRKGDVELLTNHFVEKICKREGRALKNLDRTALALLNGYPWPGNVRELENAVVRAVVLADSDIITQDDFPQIIEQLKKIAGQNKRHNRRRSDIENFAKDIDPKSGGLISIFDINGEVYPMDYVEKMMIKVAHDKYNGKMTEIAKRLQIGRSTLYRKAVQMGLLDN